MARRDGLAFELIAQSYFEKAFGVRLSKRRIIVHAGDKHLPYNVDLASEDESVLIACKSYTFRPGGNRPNGKFDQARDDALLLTFSDAKRKILVFDDDVHPKSGSLASAFEKWSRKWRPGNLEIWRHWSGKFERVTSEAT